MLNSPQRWDCIRESSNTGVKIVKFAELKLISDYKHTHLHFSLHLISSLPQAKLCSCQWCSNTKMAGDYRSSVQRQKALSMYLKHYPVRSFLPPSWRDGYIPVVALKSISISLEASLTSYREPKHEHLKHDQQ